MPCSIFIVCANLPSVTVSRGLICNISSSSVVEIQGHTKKDLKEWVFFFLESSNSEHMSKYNTNIFISFCVWNHCFWQHKCVHYRVLLDFGVILDKYRVNYVLDIACAVSSLMRESIYRTCLHFFLLLLLLSMLIFIMAFVYVNCGRYKVCPYVHIFTLIINCLINACAHFYKSDLFLNGTYHVLFLYRLYVHL